MFFHNAGSTDLADFHFRVEGAARRGPLTRCCFRLPATLHPWFARVLQCATCGSDDGVTQVACSSSVGRLTTDFPGGASLARSAPPTPFPDIP
jgi:hypothetical protein